MIFMHNDTGEIFLMGILSIQDEQFLGGYFPAQVSMMTDSDVSYEKMMSDLALDFTFIGFL